VNELKNIVIIGASSGIGAALTRALAGDGHHLFVGARRSDRLANVTDNGALARYAALDAAEQSQVKDFFDQVATEFEVLDVLIVCAGTYGPIGPLQQLDPAAWWSSVTCNLFGTFLSVRYAVPLMRVDRKPRIITFSGGGAFTPLPRYSAYATSKAGVVRFTETIAQELAPAGITVNAVAPGFVRTEIHQATLAAGPEAAGEAFYALTRQKLTDGAVPMEVPVACIRFLISSAADELTGKTLSASFDPWTEPEFVENACDITASDVYTMRRINPDHLSDGPLRTGLQRAMARKIGKG
jgi:NAD(P)-dependent dehydrogenase (short-subunit alcohol dehydrogenase family)